MRSLVKRLDWYIVTNSVECVVVGYKLYCRTLCVINEIMGIIKRKKEEKYYDQIFKKKYFNCNYVADACDDIIRL